MKEWTQQHTNQMIFLSIFGLSIIIAMITLIIALRKRLYSQLLSEFMIYVLLSEILYASSRFLSLSREKIEEPIIINLSYNMIQIFCSISCDISTCFSTLIICLKIFDGLLNNSKIFNRRFWGIFSRIFLIILSFGSALILCLLQLFIYNIKEEEKKKLLCRALYCQLSNQINVYLVFGIIGITLIIMIVIIGAICAFCKKTKQLKRLSIVNQNIKEEFNTIQCRLWIYPIVSALFWGWRFVFQAINQDGIIPIFVQWMYSISNGLRGTMYSIVFVLSHNDLMETCLNLLCCCCKRKETTKESNVIMNDSYSFQEGLMDLNENDDINEMGNKV